MNQRAFLWFIGGLVVAVVAIGSFVVTRSFQPEQAIIAPPQPQPRTAAVIKREIDAVKSKFSTLNRQDLLTAAGRVKIDKAAIIPLLRQQLELGRELAAIEPSADEADDAQLMLMVLGHGETLAAIDAEAATDTPSAVYARSLRSMADYVMHDADAGRQKIAIDQFFEILKATSSGNDRRLVARIKLFVKAPSATLAVREHLKQRISESIADPARTQLLERLVKNPATTTPS